MPYYRCSDCALLSYSAAHHSTVGGCAHCDAPLAVAEEVERPTAQAPDGSGQLVTADAGRPQ